MVWREGHILATAAVLAACACTAATQAKAAGDVGEQDSGEDRRVNRDSASPDSEAPDSTSVADADRILVTGSLIRGTAENGAAPVEVIDSAELARRGSPSMLDLLRQLPTSAGVLGDASQFDPRTQFNQGSASVNLRGLGPQRTLVLLNGRRMVASGAGSLPLVDVNLMPASALERIEILRDGAATIHGSDAIAGVVNLITRTGQDGFRISGDYRYVPGSDGDQTAALSYGGHIGPVRLFFSAGYQHRSELRVTDRDFGVLPYARNPQGGYSGGGSPGNFDFDAGEGGMAFTADEGCEALGGFRSLPGSSADLCYSSYLAFTNLIEPEDRFQLFGDAEWAIAPGSDLRLTGLFGRTDTVLNTSPSFLPTIAPSDAAAFGGSGMFTIPAYAPALADYCARFGEAAGCALDASGAPQAPALAFPVRFRPFLAGGNPLFGNDRGVAALDRYSEAMQFTAEFRHAIGGAAAGRGKGLELTASATFSEYDRWFQVGDSFVDLLQNAMAGFGGADCAYADPASRAGLSPAELAAIAGTGGCTWFNPFSTAIPGNRLTGAANPHFAGAGNPLGLDATPGAGLVNDLATIGHFYNVWERRARTRQWVGDLTLAGGSGIALPDGEVRFAIGAQYRRDSYARSYSGGNNLDLFPCPGSVLDSDAICAPETGALGFIGAGRDVDVSSDVGALFAEVQLPVTGRISAQLAARYEDYGGMGGSTFDPQARLRVELADWLALRGGIGTTFRGAPPQNMAGDLVSLTFIGGAFRAVDLLGNPDLRPESATTYNAGLMVDRGGFRASLDYWRYEFSDAIEAEPVSGMVSALFGASGDAHCGDPAYAGLEARFTFSGGICGIANVQRLATYSFNSADVTTSGFDARASHDWRPGGGLEVQLGVSGSYVIDYAVDDIVVEGVVVQPAFDAAGKLNYQTTAYALPRLKGQAWLETMVELPGMAGGHSLRFQLNHTGSYRDERDNLFAPDNAALAGAAVSEGRTIGSYTTLDAIWRWSISEGAGDQGAAISIKLANILDTPPPFARLDYNFDPTTADALGFTAKLGLEYSF